MAEAHETPMRRVLELARLAEGDTHPNPLVGCVILRDGVVLAEGYHRRAGTAHAEADALRKLAPGEARGADVYVNLEPCSTHGRTPPCADALIAAGVRRVIVGAVDTNPHHDGAGLDKLRDAGIEVVVGVLRDECRRLNAPYYSTMERGRVWVSAKWAMTLDGKLATATGSSEWISNEASRAHVQQLRRRYDAVLVGTGTLLHDDPRLTFREDVQHTPLRVVVDANLRATPDARVFDLPGTIVAHAAGLDFAPFAARGAVSMPCDLDAAGRVPMLPVLRELVQHQVMSVLCEGGGTLLGSMFDEQLIDRVYAFVAPRLVGGADAITPLGGQGIASMPDAVALRDVRVEQFGDDVLIVGDLRSCSPAS